MKNFLFIPLVSCLYSTAQEPYIVVEKAHFLFRGAINPISIYLDNYNSSELSVTVNGGSISPAKKPGSYNWQLCESSNDTLMLRVYHKSRLVDSQAFYVKSFPDPDIRTDRVLNRDGVSRIRNARKLIISPGDNLIEDIQYTIKRFRIIVYRQGAAIADHDNIGAVFDNQTQAIVDAIDPGDFIMIERIIIQVGCEPVARVVGPLFFTSY